MTLFNGLRTGKKVFSELLEKEIAIMCKVKEVNNCTMCFMYSLHERNK